MQLDARALNIRSMVEPDRVHRLCYTDPEIFQREMDLIHERTWIYVGHESQVKKPGDYWTTFIGREPVIMVRGTDHKVHVLYNRCPHRGAMLCPDHHGNAGKVFRCTYHAWQFHLDGKLESLPIPKGYEGTRLTADNPDANIKPVARVESYRGFVFANLSSEGPDLLAHLGRTKAAFDDLCDRAPEGEVDVVATCFRMVQKSNWKLFLENQIDGVHPAVVHESTGKAATEVERKYEKRTGKKPPLSYHYISAFNVPIEKFGELQTTGHPHGHCTLEGYMGLRPKDPETLEYEKVMHKHYGKQRTEEILGVNLHHVLIYPCLSVQSPLQQLRAVRPLAVDRTLTEIWHFRLKGAPEPIYRRALDYYYLVNAPSTMINADDLDNFWRCHEGLRHEGGDWVSFHRNAGQDPVVDGITRSVVGSSEAPMRNMFKAWAEYMSEEN